MYELIFVCLFHCTEIKLQLLNVSRHLTITAIYHGGRNRQVGNKRWRDRVTTPDFNTINIHLYKSPSSDIKSLQNPKYYSLQITQNNVTNTDIWKVTLLAIWGNFSPAATNI